jgi:hypothetical protein
MAITAQKRTLGDKGFYQRRKIAMNTAPNSICAPSGLASTLGAARLAETTGATPAKDTFGIAIGFLARMSRGLSVAAKIFDGIAGDRQTKQINAILCGQDRVSDSLERRIEDIALGRRTRF